MPHGTIDQIDGTSARIMLEQGASITVPLQMLPSEIAVGQTLVITFETEEQARRSTADNAKALLNEVLQGSN